MCSYLRVFGAATAATVVVVGAIPFGKCMVLLVYEFALYLCVYKNMFAISSTSFHSSQQQ